MGIGVEERLATLEREVAGLKSKLENSPSPASKVPWWERIADTFLDDPAYEKAMKLGRDYRASLRPGTRGVRKS